MGYQTHYTFKLIRPANDEAVRVVVLKAILDQSKGNADFEERVTWYEWEADCKAVSAKYPDVLFAIDGEGEEAGDQWRCFFLGGESEVYKQVEWQPPDWPKFPQLPH